MLMSFTRVTYFFRVVHITERSEILKIIYSSIVATLKYKYNEFTMQVTVKNASCRIRLARVFLGRGGGGCKSETIFRGAKE